MTLLLWSVPFSFLGELLYHSYYSTEEYIALSFFTHSGDSVSERQPT